MTTKKEKPKESDKKITASEIKKEKKKLILIANVMMTVKLN